ncbi:MAG: hypothetical protein ACREQI_08005 [Candidatus Binataceae bacterium]
MNASSHDRCPWLASPRALFLLAVAIAAGCGVNGAAWRPLPVPADRGVVYMYRPYEFIGSGAAPLVTCGPESIELEAGGYYAFLTGGGPIVCSAANARELRFDARPGESYYVREKVESGGVQFSLMKGGAGRDEIASTRLQAPLPAAGQ